MWKSPWKYRRESHQAAADLLAKTASETSGRQMLTIFFFYLFVTHIQTDVQTVPNSTQLSLPV